MRHNLITLAFAKHKRPAMSKFICTILDSTLFLLTAYLKHNTAQGPSVIDELHRDSTADNSDCGVVHMAQALTFKARPAIWDFALGKAPADGLCAELGDGTARRSTISRDSLRRGASMVLTVSRAWPAFEPVRRVPKVRHTVAASFRRCKRTWKWSKAGPTQCLRRHWPGTLVFAFNARIQALRLAALACVDR